MPWRGPDYMIFNISDIQVAIKTALKRRKRRIDFRIYVEKDMSAEIYKDIETGEYKKKLGYEKLVKRNNNGKIRNILQPNSYTLILQHLCIQKLQPIYDKHDLHIGLNCKKGCGITAKIRKNSVNRKMKHIFFDCRNLNYSLTIDQRQCYAHIKKKIVRKCMKEINVPKELIDFAIDVSFDGNVFPIGTPTSPLLHHIVMLSTDKLLVQLSPKVIRYADDCFLTFETKEEANTAKWRIQNLWWYKLLIRAKEQSIRIRKMTDPTDFCGNVYYRNKDKTVLDHDKGYVKLRNYIYAKAKKSNCLNYPSYFGLLKAVDGYNALLKIENNNMELQSLTKTIKVSSNGIYAPGIDIKELYEKEICFDILKYDVRKDKDGKPNWIRSLIALNEVNENGIRITKEFVGNFEMIASFINMCEEQYASELVPIENCYIDKHGSFYILRDSLQLIVGVKNNEYIYK
jgi:hypothetical protein